MSEQTMVSAGFSSAHFYAQASWSEEKNRAEFGRCFDEHGHGHDYRVEAFFEGNLAPGPLESFLRGVVDPLDHRHLNFAVPEFRTSVPTTENIARLVWGRIAAANPPAKLARLRLFETPDLWVEVTP